MQAGVDEMILAGVGANDDEENPVGVESLKATAMKLLRGEFDAALVDDIFRVLGLSGESTIVRAVRSMTLEHLKRRGASDELIAPMEEEDYDDGKAARDVADARDVAARLLVIQMMQAKASTTGVFETKVESVSLSPKAKDAKNETSGGPHTAATEDDTGFWTDSDEAGPKPGAPPVAQQEEKGNEALRQRHEAELKAALLTEKHFRGNQGRKEAAQLQKEHAKQQKALRERHEAELKAALLAAKHFRGNQGRKKVERLREEHAQKQQKEKQAQRAKQRAEMRAALHRGEVQVGQHLMDWSSSSSSSSGNDWGSYSTSSDSESGTNLDAKAGTAVPTSAVDEAREDAKACKEKLEDLKEKGGDKKAIKSAKRAFKKARLVVLALHAKKKGKRLRKTSARSLLRRKSTTVIAALRHHKKHRHHHHHGHAAGAAFLAALHDEYVDKKEGAVRKWLESGVDVTGIDVNALQARVREAEDANAEIKAIRAEHHHDHHHHHHHRQDAATPPTAAEEQKTNGPSTMQAKPKTKRTKRKRKLDKGSKVLVDDRLTELVAKWLRMEEPTREQAEELEACLVGEEVPPEDDGQGGAGTIQLKKKKPKNLRELKRRRKRQLQAKKRARQKKDIMGLNRPAPPAVPAVPQSLPAIALHELIRPSIPSRLPATPLLPALPAYVACGPVACALH